MLSLALSLMAALNVATPGSQLQTTPRELIRNEVMVEVQERVNSRKEEREQKREEFKERLQNLKNERQRNILENLNNRLGVVVQNMLEHYASVLDRLGNLLDKLEARANNLADEGMDISKVNAQISDARKKIAEAQAMLEEVSEEIYVLEINEDNLGSNVRNQVASFKADQIKVKTAVEEARQSVGVVIRLLREGVDGQ